MGNNYFFFFFNETQPTEIYTTRHTLSLHDALPICRLHRRRHGHRAHPPHAPARARERPDTPPPPPPRRRRPRSAALPRGAAPAGAHEPRLHRRPRRVARPAPRGPPPLDRIRHRPDPSLLH